VQSTILALRRVDRQRLQSALDDAGDGVVVFLQHHHIAVAVDAAADEVDEGVGDAGLRQMVISRSPCQGTC
jgi:hypothetical protein